MKVIAYSIKPFEKEILASANAKKHDITLISNALSPETAFYAEGKEAVTVFTNDDVSGKVLKKLAGLGVRFIATRSAGTDHIDLKAAEKLGMQVANVPDYSPQAIAEHSVALAMALSRKLVTAATGSRAFDFRLDPLIGFTFHGKTVGLLGAGNTGKAAAEIFKGLGCNVLIHDPFQPVLPPGTYPASLEELYAKSDIISLHVPLTPGTRYLVNKNSIGMMKKGVMLLNTARGGILDTTEVLAALKSGQIGYLGLDVYEHEKSLFFEDHRADEKKDALLAALLELPNVIITPHQGFLTREALKQIATRTIENLNQFSLNI